MRLEGEEHIHCGYDLKHVMKVTVCNEYTRITNNQTQSSVERIEGTLKL